MITQHRIGVLAPFDFALDRELGRWLPPEVSSHTTLLPDRAAPVTLRAATRDVLGSNPSVVVYASACAGFVSGAAGERAIRAEITGCGAPAAVTTSGALVTALAELGASRVAVLTPYPDELTERLRGFLAEHGVRTTAGRGLGLSGRTWRLGHADVLAAASSIDLTGADALFVGGANVPGYDLVAPLERLLGLPVLTANQVSVWAALRELGLAAVGPGQRLIEPRPALAADAA